MIAVESLLFLLGGIVLTVVLMQLLGRPSDAVRERIVPVVPVVKLTRMVDFPDHHEELRLSLNGKEIAGVSDEGLRQDAYAAESERLEALATRIAAALNVTVELSRVERGARRRALRRGRGQGAAIGAQPLVFGPALTFKGEGSMMLDVIACGELLIDFVSTTSGVTLAQAPAFKKAAGGAPANVAAGVARLGHRAGFMGQVGDDDFGHFLADTLADAGVDTGGLQFSAAARTALAFVSLEAGGERSFMFYRHPSADMLWRPEDVDVSYAAGTRIFHYGSISLIGEPSRSATLYALEQARQAGALISYDPNLRLPLWPSPEAARTGMLAGWQHADLAKVSEEELVFMSGEADLERGARSLWHDRLRLLVVTCGASGCLYFTPGGRGAIPGYAVQAVDTTGAGDGFVAGLLTGLLECNLDWDTPHLEHALRLGNAVGALTTTQLGAIPALPARPAVEALMGRGEGS